MAMEPFTYDAESTVLDADEMRSFAEAVHYLCHLQIQHELSNTLAGNKGVSDKRQCDRAQLKARQMWRTEVRS